MKIILIADTHLRESVPECRTDDYHKAQHFKMNFLRVYQEKFRTPILDAGDIFNYWKTPPFIETWAIKNLPKDIITIPGNHELPSHNLNLLPKSSLSVLEAAKTIRILREGDRHQIAGNIMVYGYPWGTKVDDIISREGRINIALIHDFIAKRRDLLPGVRITLAKRFLRDHPQFKLVVSGHNHEPFMEEYQGRILVNPGSMMRMFADQGDMKPGFYVWDVGKHEVERIDYPIEKGVVSREHIKQQQDRDARWDSFVQRMEDNYEVGLKFEKNLENYFKSNKERKPVKQLAWEALE